MNLVLRKMALLEQEMIEKENEAKFNGMTSSFVDKDLQNRITKLMDKVRMI